MSWIDWAVFVAFLVWVVIDGLKRTRDTKSLEDYYAGGRRIPWWAAGLSIMATQASAITVIGTTGKGHEGGMAFLQTYIGLPVAMVLLCIFIVPLLRERPILTAYEYLEHRFGPFARTIASVVFLVSRCAALGIVIYAPAVVLSATTGLSRDETIVILGAVTTGYVLFGGVSAVVWTDVKQMLVIVAGLVIVLVALLMRLFEDLSLQEMLLAAGAADKLNAIRTSPASLDLLPSAGESFWTDEYNVLSGLFGGTFLMLAYFGCDQSQAQRLLTSSDANQSRKALLLSGFAKLPMQILVLFIGVLLWLFHTVDGGALRYDTAAFDGVEPAAAQALEAQFEVAESERRQRLLEFVAAPDDSGAFDAYRASVLAVDTVRAAADELVGDDDVNFIFPHFVLNELPVVIVGLIFAAIFAAAMSSADSVLNSLSAASVVDLYVRWIRPSARDSEALVAGRISTLLWGGFATASALWLAGDGAIIEQVNKIGSFFYGTLLGSFVLALLCRRAGETAACVGMLGGMATVLAVHWSVRVQFLWYNLIGCVAVVAIGWLVATIRPRDAGEPAGQR
ncbi:MAG: sodium:solute symporter [Planctomycetes bacterium]|nr:sodium:solute symporter [Planctomycetota bacterium]